MSAECTRETSREQKAPPNVHPLEPEDNCADTKELAAPPLHGARRRSEDQSVEEAGPEPGRPSTYTSMRRMPCRCVPTDGSGGGLENRANHSKTKYTQTPTPIPTPSSFFSFILVLLVLHDVHPPHDRARPPDDSSNAVLRPAKPHEGAADDRNRVEQRAEDDDDRAEPSGAQPRARCVRPACGGDRARRCCNPKNWSKMKMKMKMNITMEAAAISVNSPPSC